MCDTSTREPVSQRTPARLSSLITKLLAPSAKSIFVPSCRFYDMALTRVKHRSCSRRQCGTGRGLSIVMEIARCAHAASRCYETQAWRASWQRAVSGMTAQLCGNTDDILVSSHPLCRNGLQICTPHAGLWPLDVEIASSFRKDSADGFLGKL